MKNRKRITGRRIFLQGGPKMRHPFQQRQHNATAKIPDIYTI